MSKRETKALLSGDQDKFSKVINGAKNGVDAYVEADDYIKQRIGVLKTNAAVIATEVKELKEGSEGLRLRMLKYLQANSLDKIEGVTAKSISLQAEKTDDTPIAVNQIMIGRKYVDLNEVSKSDLVAMLSKLGVKLRVNSVPNEKIIPASIRVLR
jgi:hypothetical protein